MRVDKTDTAATEAEGARGPADDNVPREVPCLVGLYALSSGRLAAEFHWSPASGVSLRVFDEKWGGLAQDDYDDGISSDAQHRMVFPNEGEAFMKALIEPRQPSYYRYFRLGTGRIRDPSDGHGDWNAWLDPTLRHRPDDERTPVPANKIDVAAAEARKLIREVGPDLYARLQAIADSHELTITDLVPKAFAQELEVLDNADGLFNDQDSLRAMSLFYGFAILLSAGGLQPLPTDNNGPTT